MAARADAADASMAAPASAAAARAAAAAAAAASAAVVCARVRAANVRAAGVRAAAFRAAVRVRVRLVAVAQREAVRVDEVALVVEHHLQQGVGWGRGGGETGVRAPRDTALRAGARARARKKQAPSRARLLTAMPSALACWRSAASASSVQGSRAAIACTSCAPQALA